jgi:hypothetical protein
MLFEKELDGNWNNTAISFAHDLIFLTDDAKYDNPSYKKLIDFLAENRDCRDLVLKYHKEKYEAWKMVVDELREERKCRLK